MKKLILAFFAALMLLLLALGLMLVQVRTNIWADLSALNLPGVHVYRDMAMHSGEGFHAFVMPWYRSREDPTDLRQLALADMMMALGWHVEPVDASALWGLSDAELPLQPASGTVCDAWFLRVNDVYPAAWPAARPDGQWTAALFDADTGVFYLLTEKTVGSTGEWSPISVGLGSLAADWGHFPVITQSGKTRLTALTIPAGCRAYAEAKMAASADWHESSVPRDEFVRLMGFMQEEVWPQLLPPEGTDFDVQLQQGPDKTNHRLWRDAWYDRESGLLVICERER